MHEESDQARGSERTRARAARRGLGALALLLPAAAGCHAFPLSLYVEGEVLDELSATSFRSAVDDREIAAGMRERLGYDGGRAPYLEEAFHRLDLAPADPFSPAAADDPASPFLAGLASGDVILAKNPKAQSLAATLSFAEFAYYDHLGVLVFEDGGVWVYEAWPRLRLLSTAPDFISRFQGHVDRVPLREFLARYETLELVRLPDPGRNARAVEAARRSRAQRIPYDPYHDPEQPGLSCSEYVEMLFLAEAGYPAGLPPRPLGRNAAWARIADSLGFRAPAYVVPDDFAGLEGARSVGIISRHRTLAEARAMRTAFRVLHDRDRPDSPAGDYLAAHPWHFLVYRDTTLAYFEWTKGYVRAHPEASEATLRAAIETIYDLCFRPRRPAAAG
ncbi:MAG: hypothetical protein AB1726_18210 [Planctomycetota bacterium]